MLAAAIRRSRSLVVSVSLAAGALIAGLAGCNRSTDTGGVKPVDGTSVEIVSGAEAGKSILLQMAAAYRNAPAYRDRGELKLTVRSPNSPHTETFPYSVEFARPNKLRIEAYSTTLASDGKTVVGKIASPETNDFQGQVLVLDAPAEVTAEAVAQFDEALQRGLSGINAWPMSAMLLLLGGQFEQQFKAAERVAVLPSQSLEGRDCHVVQIEDDDGRSVWWIDKENSLMRRVEYSVNGFAQQYNLVPSEVSLVADFHEAAFSAPADERFSLEIAENAERVKILVPPPVLPPDKLVGEASPAFAFDTFGGKDFADKAAGKLTAESLRGKAAMLLLTANRDGRALAALDALAKQYRDRSDVALVAVISDSPDELSDAELRAAMKGRAPAYTVARATNATAAFGILSPSAAIFLGKEGVVEDAILLDTFGAVQFAPEIFATLLADKPWHPRALGRIEEDRRVFEKQLVVAKTGRVAPAEAAPQIPPREHRLVSLWKQGELKEPGNILVDERDGKTMLLVLDGPRTVVEIDAVGSVATRHELKLPDGGEIGFVRAGKKRDGTRFYVGSRLFLPKVYIFDEAWHVAATYPDGPIPANEDNPAVGDVLVADIDLDGGDEIVVGYAGIHGVHLVSPESVGVWRNRSVSQVSRLATGPGEDEKTLVYAAAIGAPPAMFDGRGKELGRWPAEAAGLSGLAISPPLATPVKVPAGETKRAYLGMAMIRNDQFAVVGLTPSGQALWQYPLPPGVPGTQVEAVTWGRAVGESDHWTIAAPDGSIHLLAADGNSLDYFALGSLLAGLAPTTIDGKPALVVARKSGGVEAFRLEKAETIRPAE